METLKKVGKWAGIAFVCVIVLWSGYHVFFTSVADSQALDEQPGWMHSLPDFIRYMVVDIQKLF